MSIFALRTRLSVTLVVSVAILVPAYSYAGYLVRKRSSPDAGVGRPPAASAPSPQQLLAAGDAHLKAGRAEQALLAYREVLAANPDSLPAQLGVAQGELLAGR